MTGRAPGTALEADPAAAGQRSRWWRVLLAVGIVQALYWLGIHPLLKVPVGKLERIAVHSSAYAELDDPSPAAWRSANDKTTDLPWEDCCQAGYRSVRMQFDLPAVPNDGLAIVPIVGSDNYQMWLNDALLLAEGRIELPDHTYHGNVRAVFRLPAALLREGRNELRFVMVRDRGSPHFFVASPIIGDYATIKAAFRFRAFLLNEYNIISYTIGLTLAALALIVAWRGEQRAVLAWLVILFAAWSLRLIWYDASDPPLRGEARMVLLFALVNLLPLAWLNLANQWGPRPLRGILSVSLVAWLALSVLIALILYRDWFERIDTVNQLGMGFNALLGAATLLIFGRQLGTLGAERATEIAVFALCLCLIIVDAGTALFGRGTQHVATAMPWLMIGLVAAFLARNVQLFRSSAQINRLLSERLAQREAELTRTHEQLREAERTQVLAAERQRLMQDMHDGVGGQLAALLSLAQSRQPEPQSLLRAVAEGLTDLRLIIDSLNQIDDDLALALGSLRGRLQPLLDAAGVALRWQLDARLSLPGFGPEAVLQVYRIVQEAVSNALRHGQPSQITIALTQLEDAVELRIEDDGRGLAEAAGGERRGLGLRAMAGRAQRVGASCQVESSPGEGTRVRLRWPGGLAAGHSTLDS